MKSLSCITPFKALTLGFVGCLALLLLACGGSKPRAGNSSKQQDMRLADETAPGDKGAGMVSFRITNKSAVANLNVDLGATEVYLEMSGKSSKIEEPSEAKPAAVELPKAKASDPDKDEMQEDQGSNEDVTGKVLTGIRKAQELFYQKRYPEAMQMVKQSLDASPTAEGYALAGSISYMMGQNDVARKNWKMALKINPDMPAVSNMLNKTSSSGGRSSSKPMRPRAAPDNNAPAGNEAAPPAKAAPAEKPAASQKPPEQIPFPEEYDSEPAEPQTLPAVQPTPPVSKPAPTAADSAAKPATQKAPVGAKTGK